MGEEGLRAEAVPLFEPNIDLFWGFFCFFKIVIAVNMHQRYSALYWEQTDTQNTHTFWWHNPFTARPCKRGTNDTVTKTKPEGK